MLWSLPDSAVRFIQKQPSRGALKKRCFENMQQIYRRTHMPKHCFNNVALQLYWNRTSARAFSCKFAAPFLKNTSVRMLLFIVHSNGKKKRIWKTIVQASLSKHLFDVLNESEDKNHITAMLICLDKHTGLFFKKLIFKSSKNLLHTPKISLYLRKYLTNQNKNYILMIRKN